MTVTTTSKRATPTQIRDFFSVPVLADGTPGSVSAAELMRTKHAKGSTDPLPDYDQLAEGIGNGTLNY
jgi:hypothetical protein